MNNPGFWLILAIFSLGLAWPITSAITRAMRWIDDRIDNLGEQA